MSVQLQIETLPDYLIARFTGNGGAEEVWKEFEFIAEQCNLADRNKLLLDFTGAHGPISFADRYFLGENARAFARHGLKVVSLARADQVDPRKFGELVARNRGVNLRTFTDVSSAEQWFRE
jgi:hypothetical protein